MARPYNAKLLSVLFIVVVLLTSCFPVAVSNDHESKPAIATNTKTGDFLVAYLLQQTYGMGTLSELRITRLSANGAIQESALQPLGSASHNALGRPAIAYSPSSDRFFVAIPERVDTTTGVYDRVIGRYLDGMGHSLPIPEFLFDDPKYTYYDGSSGQDPGSVHVVYNSVQDEFLVTVQMTVNGNNVIYAQRMSMSGKVGPVLELYNSGSGGFDSHTIAYAPIDNQTSPGGRYLFVVKRELFLLDAQLNPVKVTATNPNKPTEKTSNYIPVSLGVEQGREQHFDVAYGEIEGKLCFLVVWQDPDNMDPGATPPREWTGIWGTYIDATREYYTDFQPHTEENTPFPISKIFEHTTTQYFPKPRVTYSPSAKAFFVVWRELPTNHSLNDTRLSHIRGVWVDYFVPDGIVGTSLVPEPHDNVVLSQVHGSCQTTYPYLCLSDEDPDFPAVAGLSGQTAAVVWEQSGSFAPNAPDIVGEFLTIP